MHSINISLYLIIIYISLSSKQNAKRCINRSMSQSKTKSLKMEYNIANRYQLGWFPARVSYNMLLLSIKITLLIISL